MILLIGNYPLDRQQSMERFALMMLDGLKTCGVEAEIIRPRPVFGRLASPGTLIGKWLGYIDKFVLFRGQLGRRLGRPPQTVHICDHSNAIYARWIRGVPVVVTCHDLLAVRGALGENTDCPASATGKFLQRWILRGLEAANAIACVSRATLRDAQRLLRITNGKPELVQITLGLSYPYRTLGPDETRARLIGHSRLMDGSKFVLHVGSNLRRKNREAALRIFARCREEWNGLLVFAGEPLSSRLRSSAEELGIADRVLEIPAPDNELLEGLYNGATALLFPSTFEGFGWPIAEAHACGCPVLCADREPMSEVAGDAGLTFAVEDEAAFAAAILRLTDAAEHGRLKIKALENARRFSASRMVSEYVELYRSLGVTAA
jgi:glycosyltransferase involved in cell wall biosynthesis